jgi:Icc-related predicted phosphoesterase
MKIIYCTDILGSMVQVYNLLRETIADLYILGGDLLNMPFYSIDQSMDFFDIQKIIHKERISQNKMDLTLEDFALSLIDSHPHSSELYQNSQNYIKLCEAAEHQMQKKYQMLENICSSKPHVPIYLLPGTNDLDLAQSALAQRNLHMNSIKIDNITIAGYGASPGESRGFPEKLRLEYRGMQKNTEKNELIKFFEDSKPDVIICHHPAYKMLDSLPQSPHFGSEPLRNYCDNNEVICCLSGHINEIWGAQLSNNTAYLNPSHFGSVINDSGELSEGGSFFDFEINGRTIERIDFKKIAADRIYNLAQYNKSNETYNISILDEGRYNSMVAKESCDRHVDEYIHTPELKIFRDIRNFFRINQTVQTEDRVKVLEDAIASLGEYSDKIAMDAVGSISMGVAKDSSDADVVLYLKNLKDCKTEDPIDCEETKEIIKKLEHYLEDKTGFEIIDCINLDQVKISIENKNKDCDSTQRFTVYRSFCRPINYPVIAPFEDMLNENLQFRKIVEENISAYLMMLGETADTRRSFEKYMTRLKTMGIKIPDSVIKRIQTLLNKPVEQ